MTTVHRRYFQVLAVLYGVIWLLLAIDPLDRNGWLLENVIVVIAVFVLWATYKWMPLSRVSYTMIFIFMCLHSIGSHYTYSEVPYDRWFISVSGRSLNELLNWERNHFDRVIHFLYGLLLAYPIREMFLRIADVHGFWSYFLPLDLTMSTSMFYELIEWAAAEIFGGELGMAYLGTQGDVWDAHKDMALASLGALLAILLIIALNSYLQRDFAREWSESLRVKHKEPLGEEAIRELWRDKHNTHA